MNNWTNIYNEIMSFYFYEPNHIGKRAYPKESPHAYSKEPAMLQHIANMEVSLNHMLSILLSISPNSLTRLITKKAFGATLDDNYFFDQVNVAKVNKIMGDATQPDIVMTGKKNRVMIEMKIGSKTNLDQYYKYLLFTYFMDKESKLDSNYLIYLAKGTMAHAWKEKFNNQAEIKRSFEVYVMPEKSKKGRIDTASISSDLLSISKDMKIGFLSYQDLFDILEKEVANNMNNEILVNLYRGFSQELMKRHLVE